MTTSLSAATPILLVGVGNMGRALLSGWLAAGIDPRHITAQDPLCPAAERTALIDHGVRFVEEGAARDLAPAVIVLAVKPQILDAVAAPLASLASDSTVVVSIAAGRTIDSVRRLFPPQVAIVRAMPNSPAAVGQGMTVCCSGPSIATVHKEIATQLMAAVGQVAWIDDEALMDAVTAVSGSGPAYVFYLAECLAEAGVDAGLDPDLAARLARATVAGAGAMLSHHAASPAELRGNVTSPGGTTAAALAVLMSDEALGPLIRQAVQAAVKRGRELGSG
jgi:pyrroline-5-carboxylate reductase